ncbi:cutinase family protein [Rhodococcus erythropolis]
MPVRGFFSRHRILAGAVAPAALGVAALVAVAVAVDSPQSQTIETELTASVTECHDTVGIGVAGRGDTPVEGTTKMLVGADGTTLLPAALTDDYSSYWVDPVLKAPAGSVKDGSYASVYIAYPANMDSYEEAVTTGADNTRAVMKAISAACPNTKFSIVGYSEGADVVRRVAMDIGSESSTSGINPDNVVGVVIFADAGRLAGEGPFPGAENPYANPNGFNQQYQNGKNTASGSGALPGTSGDFGALNGKIASFCSDGDLTCAAPENISLLILAANVGRQLNVDQLQAQNLTPATGMDIAVVMGRVMFDAFNDISSNPTWMQSDETFLDVLLKVSDPAYKPSEATTTPVAKDSVSTEEVSPLAYLPQKLFKEIVGLIATNQNTIPVVMNDPYGLTLGPDVGHHFDYWRDSDAANGKPLTSAEYAAAWLTYLAKQAQDGKPVDSSAKPTAEEMADAIDALAASPSVTDSAKPTTTTGEAVQPAPVGSESAAPAPAAPTTTSVAPAATPSVTSTVAPSTSVESSAPPAATTTTTTSTTTTTQVTTG